MDRRWLWRGIVALVIVAFFVLIGRAAVLAFKSDSGRLSRVDRAIGATIDAKSPAAPR